MGRVAVDGVRERRADRGERDTRSASFAFPLAFLPPFTLPPAHAVLLFLSFVLSFLRSCSFFYNVIFLSSTLSTRRRGNCFMKYIVLGEKERERGESNFVVGGRGITFYFFFLFWLLFFRTLDNSIIAFFFSLDRVG